MWRGGGRPFFTASAFTSRQLMRPYRPKRIMAPFLAPKRLMAPAPQPPWAAMFAISEAVGETWCFSRKSMES